MRSPKGTSYGDVRHSHILLNYESSPSALHALLRVDGSESQSTREKLKALGFHPAASPDRSSISWRLYVSPNELDEASARICSALGPDVVLDLGAAFQDRLPRTTRETTWWPGRFLVEVGGTQRCVVFDRSIDEGDVAEAITSEREDYFDNELMPATE